MDSRSSFKGYGKVSEAEEAAFHQKARNRKLIIIFSSILLGLVIVGAVIGGVVNSKKNNDDDPVKNEASTSPHQSIKAVCSVTQYPNSCYSSLSHVNKTIANNPKALFVLSMQVAINELTKLTALPDKFIESAKGINDSSVRRALVDCKTLFDDAIGELNASVTTISESKDYEFNVNDLKTWLSSAITDQETCLDGLDETNATSTIKVLNDMKSAMKNSTEFTSNSLAIVAKILKLVDDFDLPIHRKLLGVDIRGNLPEWVSGTEQRMLIDDATTKIKPDFVVAKDESGNFKTINEVVKAIALKNKTRTVVYIKAGTYVENVELDKKHWNVMMYGDGKDKTIVSGSKNYVDGEPTFTSATFIAAGKGFIAMDMGFINTAGPEKHQAVALRSGSDQSIFLRCSFDAYQDTLYAHSNRQFYRDCDIIGTIDFIFGAAAAVFQNCNIMPRQPMPNQVNTITAQGKKDPNQISGFSIHKCVISPKGNVTVRNYLGRPWKNYSITVIQESSIDGFIHPDGWFPWTPNVIPPDTILYAEYMNTGPGAALNKRVTWPGYKPVLTAVEASKYSVANLIQGPEWLTPANVKYD